MWEKLLPLDLETTMLDHNQKIQTGRTRELDLKTPLQILERSLRVVKIHAGRAILYFYQEKWGKNKYENPIDALINAVSKELIIDYIAFFISKPVWSNKACNAS